jgi:hypothetical protein
MQPRARDGRRKRLGAYRPWRRINPARQVVNTAAPITGAHNWPLLPRRSGSDLRVDVAVVAGRAVGKLGEAPGSSRGLGPVEGLVLVGLQELRVPPRAGAAVHFSRKTAPTPTSRPLLRPGRHRHGNDRGSSWPWAWAQSSHRQLPAPSVYAQRERHLEACRFVLSSARMLP